MKLRLLIFTLFLVFSHAYPQIALKSERDADGNVIMYAENSTPIPYSVTIYYKNLQNLIPDGGMTTIKVVPPGQTLVGKLKKSNPSQSSTNLNYSFISRPGDYRAKTDDNIIYLPPVKSGVVIKATPMTHIENALRGEEVNDSYVGLSITFEEPTIISAPRKGIVSDMKINEKIEGNNVYFNAIDNFIELYHGDGVFTRIKVLKPGSAMVKVGDTVFPGDPLAESAGENYGAGPHVRMVQSRLVKSGEEVTRENIEVLLRGSEGKGIQIKEMTEITVEHPEELIILEMTKKEKKKHLHNL
ncbi:M23 family metallopeptidase [Belliella pelovolcani]|uniref:Peptidase family M23 n=1 Tax=Belliella pelovolcani TaxID=529505 RepID=A0A1N7KT32_9BACT|nr:peptidoglycan DD-metalloendopeptidase family protein [Belliella pelovolcani]SIS64773.1 Peptidase family M23 [Belliella pelovolcani]